VKLFIPKQNQDIPDWYSFKIYYLDGKSDDFEGIVRINDNNRMLDIVTKDDIWHWIPLDAIKRIEFDKQFSKLVEITTKLEQEARAKAEKDIPTS